MVTSGLSSVLLKGQLAFLREKGYDVTLIASPSSELYNYSEIEDVNVYPIEMTREISIFKDIISLIKIIKYFVKLRPDICNTGTPKAGLLGIIAAYITGVPVKIYTLRGLRYEGSKGYKKHILKTVEKLTCQFADVVICISPSLQDKAVNDGVVAREKTMIIGSGSSNGIDVKEYQLTDEVKSNVKALRKELHIHDTDFIIGFVGRKNKDKGLDELVDSYKILTKSYSNIKLLIVGPIESDSSISSKTNEYINLNDNIIEVGFTKNVIPYYYLMDILVLPTYREGFGNVSIEAQATGTPVITTNVTGAKDTVKNNVTGLIVPPKNVEELAFAIEKVIQNVDLLDTMGKAAKKRAIEEFDSQIIWNGLDELYTKSTN